MTGIVLVAALAAAISIALAVVAVILLMRTHRAVRAIWAGVAALLVVAAIGTLLGGYALSRSRAGFITRPAPVPAGLSIYYDGVYSSNSRSGGTHSLRARDASLRWQRPSALGTNTFTISDGVMYLASESYGASPSTMLFALRASDGVQLWSAPIVNPALPPYQPTTIILGAPVVVATTILLNVDNASVAYDTGLVIALRRSDGRELWREVIANDEGGLVAGGDLFYLGTPASESSIRAFRVSDGTPAWQTAVNSHGARPIYDKGVVYTYPAGYGQITALRASDGNVLWTFGDPVRGIDAAVLDVNGGTVYAGGTDGTSPPSGTGVNNYVYALDAASGTLRWRFQVPNVGGTGAVGGVTAADGIAYVGATGGLYALASSTGAVRWRQSTGEFVIYYSPQIADGAIFAASDDVRLHSSPGICPDCEPDYFNALSARDGSFYWRVPLSSVSSPPLVVT